MERNKGTGCCQPGVLFTLYTSRKGREFGEVLGPSLVSPNLDLSHRAWWVLEGTTETCKR